MYLKKYINNLVQYLVENNPANKNKFKVDYQFISNI